MKVRAGILAAATASLLLALPASSQASAKLLSVGKEGNGAGTVTSEPAGIECGTTCSASFAEGAKVTLSAVSGPFSEAVKWSGCDSIAEGRCLVTMSSARSITASFKLNQRQLSVTKAGSATGTVTSSPAGISCGATCTASFGEGSTVTLTGVPGASSQPVQWAGCDSVTGEGKCLVTMSAARSVTAVFNLEGPLLSVTKAGNGAGTVTSSPAGVNCGEACAVNFLEGATVTLTGTPGPHTQAAVWSGCEKVIAEDKCVVTMSAAKAVSAAFKLEPQWVEYTITLRPRGTGKGTVSSFPAGIECGQSCAASYLFQTSLSLFAAPAPGSVFDHWSVNACATLPSCTISVRSSRRIGAVFTAVGKRTLTIAKAGTGQGTVTSKPAAIECGSTCSAELDASTKVALKAIPTAGSTFAGWSGEGCSGTKSCHVRMNEARNVAATFNANPRPSRCVVPRLAGKSLAKARAALNAAHCALGRVRKPRGARLAALRVRSSSPAAGTTLPAGAAVALRLARRR
jgi:hypothetical protein